MIRFVDMREADIAGIRFAFWDTVTDSFIKADVDGSTAWDNWAEFEDLFSDETENLQRFKRLLPAWAFESSPDDDS